MVQERLPGISELQGVVDTKSNRNLYSELHKGLRDRGDTTTWLTTIIDSRKLLGSPDPERQVPDVSRKVAMKYFELLYGGTYLEPLIPESMYALGVDISEREDFGKIDFLFLNGRHKPEPLLWNVAEKMSDGGMSVAVVNPVGHYPSRETRIIGPAKLFHDVDNAVLLASTQEEHGGSMALLEDAVDYFYEEKVSERIRRVSIVMPWIAGSRGHTPGQDVRIGHEVLQAESAPAQFSRGISALRKKLGGKSPEFRVLTVDIHNEQLPGDVFKEHGVEFESVCPMREFAHAAIQEVNEQGFGGMPVRVVASDHGALARTKRFASWFLRNPECSVNTLEIVEISKARSRAGEVERAEVNNISIVSLGRKGEVKIESNGMGSKIEGSYVRVPVDDMVDGGGTSEKEDRYLNEIYPEAAFKIFVATHPVMSLGPDVVVSRTGADVVIVGNTLMPEGISRNDKVRVVDVSGPIVEALIR